MNRAKNFMEFIKGQNKNWKGMANTGQFVVIHSSKLGIDAYLIDPDTDMTDSATSNAKTMADVWKWLSEHGVNKITWDDGRVSVKSEDLKEGLRANLEYFTLIPGEHPLGLVLDELEALVDDLLSWREDEWNRVTAVDNKHQEMIPLKK